MSLFDLPQPQCFHSPRLAQIKLDARCGVATRHLTRLAHHWRSVRSLRLAAKPPQNEPKPLDQNTFQRQTREMENKSQAEDKASKRRDRLAEALRENLKRRKQARRADNPKTEDKASK